MDPEHCRAARAYLNWTQAKLAARAGVAIGTLQSFEAGERTSTTNSLIRIERALASAGIMFTTFGVFSAKNILAAGPPDKSWSSEELALYALAAGKKARGEVDD